MNKERELLARVLGSRTFMQGVALRREIEELLAQPEHIKEREGSGNMISTDDVCNWKFIVEDIKDYDHVYVNGIRYTEFQPKRKPIFNYTVPDYITDEYIEAYDLGFSDAEKAHGIGE